MNQKTTFAAIALAAALLAAQPAAIAQAAAETTALENELKLKELQLKIRETEQKIREAEQKIRESEQKINEADTKALEQAQKAEAARRLLARQGDAEKLLDVQASSALSAAEIGQDLQLFAKLKEAFGEPPKIGQEGSIAVSEAGAAQLLAARAGSAQAALELARVICASLGKAKVSGAYVAPAGFDEKYFKSRMLQDEADGMRASIRSARDKLAGIEVASATAVVAGLNVARFLVGGAQELSKAVRSNYGYAVSNNTSRATLLETSVASTCPQAVANVNLETSLRLGAISGEFAKAIQELAAFSDDFDGKNAVVTAQLAEATKWLDAELAKPEKERNQGTINELKLKVENLRFLQSELQAVEPVSKRAKGYLESLKGRSAEVIEAMAWANFAPWAGKPRLQLTVSAQDVQVTKTSAWTTQKLSGASHLEAIYHVVDAAGKVLVSGAATRSLVQPLEMNKPGASGFSCTATSGLATCEAIAEPSAAGMAGTAVPPGKVTAIPPLQ